MGGRDWYDYLSDRFCHGRALKKNSRVSVVSTRHPSTQLILHLPVSWTTCCDR